MEYDLSGKVSLDDYIQFNKFYLKHGISRYFKYILYLVIFISILLNSKILIDTFKKSPFDFIKIWLPVIIFLILFYKIILPIIYKSLYNANKNLRQVQRIKINEHCISITTDTGNKIITKSDKNKIEYDEDSVYIYNGLDIGNIIKKRFLGNENDFEEMVKFIKLNYGKK
jgi:hypothetical protein